jgi:hemoglobin/transferrin/lactoferrin receptor protein
MPRPSAGRVRSRAIAASEPRLRCVGSGFSRIRHAASAFSRIRHRLLSGPALRATLQALALLACVDAASADTLVVHVRDAAGGAIAGAEGLVTTGAQAAVASGVTNAEGTFALERVPAGRYVLTVQAAGFSAARLPIDIAASGEQSVTVTLDVAPLSEDVTVTAEAGRAEIASRSPQAVNVITREAIAERTRSVVGQAVTEEAGVHLQRTSPTVAGIFVRGLTGNKVNVFLDGVRYTTGAQRGGINTFLDLLEPTGLETIEVLRGPNSAQYGSDALGGSVQFLSRVPAVSPDGRRRVSGLFGFSGGTAERLAGAHLTGGYSAARFGAVVNLAARQAGELRPGGGIDSHAAVTRFFGLRSDRLMDDRLPDTGFAQVGGQVRTNWTPAPRTQLVVQYMRNQQSRGRRYDQLLGGDGNLVADLRGLSLDFFYVRLERVGAGPFEHVALTYSINSQREERVNQGGNGNPRATITFEPERTTVHGVSGTASKALSARQTLQLGGDAYAEGIDAPSSALNPVTGAITVRRGRVPDEAHYAHGGGYVQTFYDLRPDRLRLHGSARVSTASYRARAADSPIVNGAPLWPDDRLRNTNAAFRAGALLLPDDRWTIAVNVSRGYRAPHVTDLGTLGLTGAGFEVAAPDVAGLSATVGTTAGRTAVSTGEAVSQVRAERSLSTDLIVRYRTRRLRAELSLFSNSIRDNIQKQALILPPGAVGTEIAGQPIVEQAAGGAVFVPASSNPVLVRANFDDARVRGMEGTLEWKPGSRLTTGALFTWLRARDLATGAPPNIEGGTPAPDAYLMVRYLAPGGRWWVEPYMHAAWRQHRLSTLDLEDRRTGATRSRNGIGSFFQNGATARGWVSRGEDGIPGTADDVLAVTGETVAAIQGRVLGPGVVSAPLFTSVPGYVAVGVRAGVRAGRHEIFLDTENLGDENYRGISWGVDAPGRGVVVKYLLRLP